MKNCINKFKKIIFLWSKKYFYFLPGAKSDSQEFIFIGGVQRSGTNMLMDILEKSYATDVFHETDSRAFDNYQMRDESIIFSLCQQSRAPKFVIKSLCELQRLNHLMTNFQPAKTIWIVRDYNDTVASMLNSFSSIREQVVKTFHDDNNEWWLGQGMTDTTRKELEELVKLDMGQGDACAVQWYFRNKLFFDQKLGENDQVLLISYEELVRQPEAEVKKVCHFIGVEYHHRMIGRVFSSSISRRKQPDIEPQIAALCDTLQLKFRKLFEVAGESSNTVGARTK